MTVWDLDGSRQTITNAAGVITTTGGRFHRGSWPARAATTCLLIAVAAFDFCWAVAMMVASAGVLQPSPRAVAGLRRYAKVYLVGTAAYLAALAAVIYVVQPPGPATVTSSEAVVLTVAAAVAAAYPLAVLTASRRSPCM